MPSRHDTCLHKTPRNDGVYDMHGNAKVLVLECWGPNYWTTFTHSWKSGNDR